MVVRTTPIRVGNPDNQDFTSGPLKNEVGFDEIAKSAGLDADKVKEAEKTSTTKRNRRVGWFDWELFRKSCILNTPTDIALTFVDYLDGKNNEARRFEQLTEDTIKFIEEIEHVAQAPVSIINTKFPDRPDLRSMIDRRHWR
jgi:adenylosuccinate synthase